MQLRGASTVWCSLDEEARRQRRVAINAIPLLQQLEANQGVEQALRSAYGSLNLGCDLLRRSSLADSGKHIQLQRGQHGAARHESADEFAYVVGQNARSIFRLQHRKVLIAMIEDLGLHLRRIVALQVRDLLASLEVRR